MSDEYDSWLENVLGVDVSTYVGGVTIEPSSGPEQYATGVEIDPAESGGPQYYAMGVDINPPDIDAGNFSSSLTGVPDDASAPTSTDAVIAEDKIPYILSETAIEEVEVEGEPEEDRSKEGEQDAGEKDDQSGGEQGGDQQEGDEGGDEEPQQFRTINASLKTAYQQKVSYWIRDATSGKMLVNGEQYPGGQVLHFSFASSDGSNGSCYYMRDSYPEGGGRVGPTHTTVRDGQITTLIN